MMLPPRLQRWWDASGLPALPEEGRAPCGACPQCPGGGGPAALATFGQHVDDFLGTATGRRFKGWQQERALYSPAFAPAERQSLEAQGYACVDLADHDRWLTPTDSR